MLTATNRPRLLVLIQPDADDAVRQALRQAASTRDTHIQLKEGDRDIESVAAGAAELGLSHVLTLEPGCSVDAAAVAALLSEVDNAPSALCVGSRPRPPWRQMPMARLGRLLSGFLFRVQTGLRVDDVTCRFRVYPVAVLRGLRFLTRGCSFETEVLVRAAWAGVELRSVPLSRAQSATRHVCLPRWRLFVERCVLAALSVHLTMRSVVPWPHRPLVPDATPRSRMTILHPLRSLRKLIMENTTPREIALAAGLGVFLGVLPLPFVHTVAIIFAASFFGVNKPAAVLASQLCMPPLVPALCVELGHLLRHGKLLTEISIRTLGYEVGDRLLEWVLGSLILAPLLALLVALIAYGVAVLLQRRMTGATARPS